MTLARRQGRKVNENGKRPLKILCALCARLAGTEGTEYPSIIVVGTVCVIDGNTACRRTTFAVNTRGYRPPDSEHEVTPRSSGHTACLSDLSCKEQASRTGLGSCQAENDRRASGSRVGWAGRQNGRQRYAR